MRSLILIKKLLFKELTLSLSPAIYFIVLLFPFSVFLISTPIFMPFVYLCSLYPLIFLGTRKGLQSNDLFFSVLLPVERKEIILARMITCTILQIFVIIFVSLFVLLFKNYFVYMECYNFLSNQGLSYKALIFIICDILVGFGIYDLIFFPLFYSTGKRIILPTILGIISFLLFCMYSVIILPLLNSSYCSFIMNMHIKDKIVYFSLCVLIYFALHLATFFLSSKKFDKVDF